MSKKTILITSASGMGYPSLARCLREKKELRIIGTAPERMAVGFAFVDKGYVISRPEDKNYIRDLMEICEKEKVEILIPTDPKELISISSNDDKFKKKGTIVLISSLEAIKIAEDKEKFFIFCKKNGIPVPNFIKVKNYEDFRKAVFQLGYPKKEVCFKPKISSGTRGFRVLSEKNNKIDSLFKEQSDNIMADFPEICSILRTVKDFPELLVMEFLPGKEYSVDILANNGKAQIVVPRTRDKIILGASFLGEIVEEKEIIKYSKDIVKGLNFNAVIGIQFRKDVFGVPKALEVNPRIQGAIGLTIAAGANIVEFAIKNALKEKWENPKIKWGTKLIRYYDEVYQNKKGEFFGF